MLANSGIALRDLDAVLALGSFRVVRKRQILLQPGEVEQYHCFVLKGLLKSYRLKENGEQYIIRFDPEYCWMANQASLHSGEPSPFFVDAVEDSELLLWSKEDFSLLIKTVPKLKSWSESLLAKSVSTSQERIFVSIGFTAEEKYEHYIYNNPDLILRIPLHMIASYLGVTRETLSRIRRRIGH